MSNENEVTNIQKHKVFVCLLLLFSPEVLQIPLSNWKGRLHIFHCSQDEVTKFQILL